MKKACILFLIVASNSAIAQQSFSSNFINDVKKYYVDSLELFRTAIKWNNIYGEANKKDSIRQLRKEKRAYQRYYRVTQLKMDLPVFGISGIGNINQESLNSLNASGKISLYARPVQFRNNAVTIYASYNKNASNNDSVIYDKLIFPEIGSSSFTGTIQFDKLWKYDNSTGHVVSPFFEFAYKKIISDSSVENQKLYFNSLTYTVGLKYIYGFSRTNPDDSAKRTSLSFFAIPYISTLNIPNEDTTDYRSLLIRSSKLNPSRSSLQDNIWTAGLKIGFQINSLQVFADFRSVINKNKIPIRELQGFHSNIGFIFNAEVFDFKKSKSGNNVRNLD